ncbi:MAG: tRNA (adenosine(37)-N6)-threonylcarbamoyltransferase complex dimerization subunit type 1 TsaB [Flavobacteriaceae bacterium]|nr:tRNA (adenosine(37)-N6)-threonylcarbamoyltransferase complex dimerization subunit type 1 TsaB [Flavobacteriaceae bacterium]
MRILNIETSSKNCSVSIGIDGKTEVLCEEISPDYKHSEYLHTFVQWALEGAELSLKDLHAVCVSAGPGSYTGLRIGTASAKGFCFGCDIPLIALNSLRVLSESHFHQEYEIIVPLMDARRMEVYTAVFDAQGKTLEETQAHILNENSFEKYRGQKILFVGNAVEKTEKFFTENSFGFTDSVFKFAEPSAEDMSYLSFQKFQNQDFEDTAYFDPLYLKEWK